MKFLLSSIQPDPYMHLPKIIIFSQFAMLLINRLGKNKFPVLCYFTVFFVTALLVLVEKIEEISFVF